ncbi:hotdog fold thioesterase [Oceanobacillus sp. J11TS1]|uniref:hotdog fold thioesterase n=1 Tax=Oceanobacillus sp. J11TS1 TaxID=2807191 RepID=UPI001AFF6582|nr:hotdog fold thioesterase [Oceanobacillus sp. J11TS1]GIO23620.1 thioesterase [Oceanobacillus sp. J11TS1]
MVKMMDEVEIHKNYYKEILNQIKNDSFAEYLGAEIINFAAGEATVQLTVQDYMLNAHSTVHGGLMYTLADAAFALACNSYGKTAVGLSTTTNFMKSATVGDKITAKATEIRRNHRIGFYRIEVETNNEVISSMEAIAYRKQQYFIDID